MPRQYEVQVVESSQVGEARRTAVRLADLAGFGETDQGKVAIIATELANNLVRHASAGKLLIQIMDLAHGPFLEFISLDSGPGIANVERCLQDGYSTGGTSGTGLGAIRRLSTEFDIFSAPSVGTAILSRLGREALPSNQQSAVSVGVISIPIAGEEVCGDSWNFSNSGLEFRAMIADGLGHGPLAQEAADASIRTFETRHTDEPKAVIEAAHLALSGTRGAAVAMAAYDHTAGRLKYAGIGNIAGVLLTATDRQGLVSHNGIVGVQKHRAHQFEYACPIGGVLIMYSDGLKSRWTPDDHPGLLARHPALIAGVLYQNYVRGRDDTTVMAVRFAPGKA